MPFEWKATSKLPLVIYSVFTAKSGAALVFMDRCFKQRMRSITSKYLQTFKQYCLWRKDYFTAAFSYLLCGSGNSRGSGDLYGCMFQAEWWWWRSVCMYVRVAKNRRSTRSCCTHDIHYAKHSNPCRSEGGRCTLVVWSALSPSRDHMGAELFFCSQLSCSLLLRGE